MIISDAFLLVVVSRRIRSSLATFTGIVTELHSDIYKFGYSSWTLCCLKKHEDVILYSKCIISKEPLKFRHIICYLQYLIESVVIFSYKFVGYLINSFPGKFFILQRKFCQLLKPFVKRHYCTVEEYIK